MKMRPFAAAALCAAAIAAGCSKSSTGPSAPNTASFAWAGSWQVTWLNLPSGAYMQPATDTLTIAQNGSAWSASYHDFMYVVSTSLYFDYTSVMSTASFALVGDSIKLNAADATDPYACVLSVTGTISGTTMHGSAAQAGPTPCPTTSWSWVAVKI